MIKVNITQARKRLEELADLADARGEVIIMRRTTPVVRLVAVPEGIKLVPVKSAQS
jgi:antitoxin (DNA-binding transcriptional repressor) of toxin-antitoxin stability system